MFSIASSTFYENVGSGLDWFFSASNPFSFMVGLLASFIVGGLILTIIVNFLIPQK